MNNIMNNDPELDREFREEKAKFEKSKEKG